MSTTFFAIVSILMSVAAQFCLKAGMSESAVKTAMAGAGLGQAMWAVVGNRYIVGGFVLYGLGAVVWLSVLSKWEVSRAYPMVGLGFVMTAAIGALLGEHVTVYRWLGILLISVGVALIGKSA
jgi:drug/metabolite transporter (DMT)-like permease